MDEILIEEKKYVSSKRAAKVTGYAKDYIGQLCREGRVPARLVGRSWYVLETAIQDHRFGEETAQESDVGAPAAQETPSTWESPRYEASEAEILPSVNRLRDEDLPQMSGEAQEEPSQSLQDSWRAWFDRVEEAIDPIPSTEVGEPGAKEEEEGPQTLVMDDGEVNIPIHTVYELPPEDLLPRRHAELRPQRGTTEEKRRVSDSNKSAGRVVRVTGIAFAAFAAVMAIIGTGYFDKYILSNSEISAIAGVGLYNK